MPNTLCACQQLRVGRLEECTDDFASIENTERLTDDKSAFAYSSATEQQYHHPPDHCGAWRFVRIAPEVRPLEWTVMVRPSLM
jgi:hypothetical protein